MLVTHMNKIENIVDNSGTLLTIANSYGHKIPIYNLERTIYDLVRSRSWFEIQDYKTALKSYIARKDKELNKLMEYAKSFCIDKKIREYMEVML